MIIDCESCVMRDLACDDCVVGALLDAPVGELHVDDDEVVALAVLAAQGLLPPLQLRAKAAGR